jgi:hypothetical protein
MLGGILPSLHLVSEHTDAYYGGWWCECVPRSVIDRHDLWMRAYIRGYDLDSEFDVKRWDTDHYGRHDLEHLGIQAVTFPVPQVVSDDRVPVGMWVLKDGPLGDLLGGKHRVSHG